MHPGLATANHSNSPGWRRALPVRSRNGGCSSPEVIDEFILEALATEVARSIDADGVVAYLERLARERGASKHVRFDHGPEFITSALAEWCRFVGTDTVFIDPGSPWKSA